MEGVISARAYFGLMREISRRVSPVMLNLQRTVPADWDHRLVELVFNLVHLRAASSAAKLRPFVLVLSSGITDPDCTTPAHLFVAAAAELLNVSTYQANLAFDRKGTCGSAEAARELLIASSLLRELVLEALLSDCALKDHPAGKIAAVLSEGYRDVMRGQYLDLYALPVLDDETLPSPSDYLRAYARRCRLLGGSSLEAVCTAGGTLGDRDSAELRALRLYGLFHGLALQVVNDIADFAPIAADGRSVGKKSEDRFADVRNRKVTYPLYVACMRANARDRRYLTTCWDSVTHDSGSDLMAILQRTEALSPAVVLARAADELALGALDGLSGEAWDVLRSSLEVTLDNKYYRHLSRTLGQAATHPPGDYQEFTAILLEASNY